VHRALDAPAGPVLPAPQDDTWVGICPGALPVDEAAAWVNRPDCGAVVTFTGTVRDHAEGRPDVRGLDYEAYEDQATARLAAVVGEARRRWPALRRVAALHRTGALEVGEAAVVVAVSTPHRADAFAATAFCIDTLKATVPIWKKETWAGGEAWGLDATPVGDPGADR